MYYYCPLVTKKKPSFFFLGFGWGIVVLEKKRETHGIMGLSSFFLYLNTKDQSVYFCWGVGLVLEREIEGILCHGVGAE